MTPEELDNNTQILIEKLPRDRSVTTDLIGLSVISYIGATCIIYDLGPLVQHDITIKYLVILDKMKQ